MAGSKITQVVVQGRRLEKLKALFFTEAESNAMLQEEAQAAEGWVKKLNQRVQQIGRYLIKDPVLQQRLSDLFFSAGLQEAAARGYFRSIDEFSARVDLRVRAKAPFLFRLLDHSDFINCDIVIHCREESDRTIVTFTQTGRSVLNVVGCIVAVILLGACIVPGVIFLYFFYNGLAIYDKMQALVVQAVHESLSAS